jgi:diguanylate cyclase (GGDEF)-like protein/PAS domain S-box-containing protein
MIERLQLRAGWPCYAYLAGGALVTALYLWVPPIAGNPYVMSGLSLSAALAILAGIRRYRPTYPGAWTWLAVSQVLFFLGDLYTYAYPKLFHHEVPFPSFGDGLYLLVYPALMAGLLLAVRRRTPQGDRAGVIDALIITLGLALLSWIFLIAPNIHAADVSAIGKAVSVAYPLGDVLVLAAAVRLAFDGGRRQASFYLLSLAVLLLLATDAAYLRALLDNAYDSQLIYDAGWIGYYLLFGASALHPSMRSLVEATPDRERKLSTVRLALLSAASLIAPAFELAREWSAGDADTMVITGASVALFLLVIMRISGLVKQQERAAAREHVLQSAGAALVAATTTTQIYDAALGALPQLLGAGAEARLCVPHGEGLALLGCDAGAPQQPLSLDAGQVLGTAAFAGSIANLSPELRAELALSPRHGLGLVLPLAVRGECLGLLVVGSESTLSPLLVTAISSLATKVSLALESDALSVEVHRRESEARFASLVRHATDLITVVGADGVVTYQSPSSERILGYTPEEVVGQAFVSLCAPADRERLRGLLDDPSRGDQLVECRLRHCEGHLVDCEIVATDLLGDEHVKGIVLNGRDVSERKAFEEQLSHQAFHDPVTSLPNRVLFADRVQQGLARASRDGTGLAVVFLDLDDFKTINDSLGHAAGDEVLREVAARLVDTVRPSDTAARFGGDEFAVLLEGVLGAQHAADVAERILDAFDTPVVLDGKQLFVRPSIGIALADEESDPGELIRNADAAMYISKRDGKRGYRVFEATMHADVVERLELRADLQRAIDENQFELFFQPVVRLDTNVVSGVEALVRWRHPERGLVQPAQFIPLAEETGLIVDLGRWVMYEGCRRAVELQAASPSPLTLAVNLSVKQLQHPEIVADVGGAIAASGIDASTLVLEITESVMMADAIVAGKRLAELKELGVRLAMDDFGTGYSSLSYLSRFPVDILKMDRSFLTPGASKQAADLAAAIVSLGETLDMQVVAEGIEQSRQMNALRDLGCDLGQGFFFARPMTFDDTISWLAEGDEDQRAA